MPPTFTPDQRWAVYVRYSSDNQRAASIEDQVRVCRDYLERNGGVFHADLVFRDEAQSGAGADRQGFNDMMSAVLAKPRSIDGILAEDLSRVSRDVANSALLFRDLQHEGVPFIGVSDGINTAEPTAKMNFTMRSLMSEMVLDDLRAKTRRGMDGRFRAGQSTGGLAFGFKSTPVSDARGEVIGHDISINEDQAEVVRRIFDLYLEGLSLSGIAKQLNANDVPTPRAGTKYKDKGWSSSTVRAMLHNERYVGIWRFNQREWTKAPGTNKRRYRQRPESDVLVDHRPDLAIIDQQTWDEVQLRLGAVKAKYAQTKEGKPKGRALPGTSGAYPFSGLLVCGECGLPMTIYGGSHKRYRCSGNINRGTCSNKLSIREATVREGILGELRRRFTGPFGVLYLRKLLAQDLGEAARKAAKQLEEHQQRMQRTRARIDKLVMFIADGNDSDSVVTALKDMEAQMKSDQRAVADLEADIDKPIALPSPAEVLATLNDLDAIIREDPARGREALRTYFRGGSIVMNPLPDEKAYNATAELLPLAVLLRDPTRKKEKTPPGESGRRRHIPSGCGGRI